MITLVRADATHPLIRRAAQSAVRDAGGDPHKEAEGIHAWIRRRVRFVEDAELARQLPGDPAEAEVLVRPIDLLRMRTPQGDCDDFSMLTAAVCAAVGIPGAFKTIAADPEAPRTYSHVYFVAWLPSGQVPMDTSHGPGPGWEAPATGKTKLWPIQEKSLRRRTLGDTSRRRTLGDPDPYTWSDTAAYTGDPGSTTTLTFPFYTGTGTPINVQSGGSGTDWGKVAAGAITSAESLASRILVPRYGNPDVPAGTLIRNPDGSVYATGVNTSQALGTGGLSGNTMLLLLLAIGGIALISAMGGHRG